MKIDKIIIDSRTQKSDLAQKFIDRSDGIPIQILSSDAARQQISELPLTAGKRVLFITESHGERVKACPATSEPYLCCRYTVINQVEQCPMDCTYCILQNYLSSPVIILHADLKPVFQQIEDLMSEFPGRLFRFGTGELGDSLALDPLTGFSSELLSYFSGKKDALIELKTKSVNVDQVLKSAPSNGVIAWSLNPRNIVRKEEQNTASVQARLRAARKCQDQGFFLAFHFDPLLIFPSWQRDYDRLIRELFDQIDSKRIAWISLGSLRFPNSLKPVILNRFPETAILNEEMIKGLDGKMRYPRPLREALYRHIYSALMKHDSDLFIYFCMEPPWIWDRIMGRSPATNSELDFWFAESLHRRFPEINMSEPEISAYQN